MDIEDVILKNLHYNLEFSRKALPHIKEEYFENSSSKHYFNLLNDFISKYNKYPDKDAILIESQNLKNVDQNTSKKLENNIELYFQKKDEVQELQWLLDSAEKWCQNRALLISVLESYSIVQNQNEKNLAVTSIPELLSNALSVSFDSRVGHNFIEDMDDFYDYLCKKDYKIPFRHSMLNRITNGGAELKTVNIIFAGTGVGKTAILCALASDYIQDGHDVLYISMEITDMEVNKRIYANIVNVPISDISSTENLSPNTWKTNVEKVKRKSLGKLIIQDYPQGSAHVGHFRYLMKELEIKEQFVPKIVIIDYLGECASMKVKQKNSWHEYYGSVMTEFCGFAKEKNICLWTAEQFNRNGNSSDDPELTDSSKSMEIPNKAHFALGITRPEELVKTDQIIVKQLKSRYRDKVKDNKFALGFNYNYMRMYETDTNVVDIPKKSDTINKPTTKDYSSISF